MRLRVLVTDDNRDNADSCAMLLQLSGHEVRTAYSGQEALTLGADFVPQLALIDISMPNMDGYEVARQIRASQWGRQLVLVAVTGWGQDADKQMAEGAGFNHHLTKPFDIETLNPLLAKCSGGA